MERESNAEADCHGLPIRVTGGRVLKEWRVETANDAKTLKETLDKVTREGWTVGHVMTGSTLSVVRGQVFTVVASREGEA